ncbi:Thrombospondin-2 [Portunus trituberculatus]|uniref:Thrombospondin-2 n=1 Tax=Portunus trituberculatus TaxID=210409 RepID=A0A5B7HP13_PORTR|nr:Thrombospondin-2 [Portunus trituberculatus]
MTLNNKEWSVAVTTAAVVVVVVAAARVASGQYLLEKTYVEKWRHPQRGAKVTKKLKFGITPEDLRRPGKPPSKAGRLETRAERKRLRLIQVKDEAKHSDYPLYWRHPNNTLEASAVGVSSSGGRERLRHAESWGPWGDWSACDATCGTGRRYRSRMCLLESCEGTRWQLEQCTMAKCR